MRFIKAFLEDETAASMVEYAILLALIAMAAIAIIFVLGETLEAAYQRTVDCFNDPPSCE